ncbi:amidohydrolase family protein [Aeoliella mucimassa]|uniref:Amidohydrolase n=1 Tax=Aeoliella mucimassa TaxID=2527972 RepID=A0A518AQ76_9BACT|nr:amidohydrolase family protein [Aeoliella mucimassa]QDU56873.1 Amidohydrolase [Aeoliella mucimassa]
MIVDVHSHAWDMAQHLTPDFIKQAARARGGDTPELTTELEHYRASLPENEQVTTIVFGGKARLSGVWVDDDYVASYVAQAPSELIGFMSLDLAEPNWDRELRRGHQELGLRGVKLMPMYAGFSPDDPALGAFWQYVQEHRLPVLLHTGTTFVSQAPIRYTLPQLMDEVAIRYPEVQAILAHLGHPYEGECIAVIRKHPNLFADISALYYRPWQLFHSLMLVQEYGVWDKLLFGTDYPFAGVKDTIDGLYRLNDITEGTQLPKLSVEAIDAMIHRDSLQLLGLK